MASNKRSICRSALVAFTFLLASTALAGAPGNTLDGDGCEWHQKTGANHCNSGTVNPKISISASSSQFCFSNPGATSAFAALKCTGGELYRGMIGQGGLSQCSPCGSLGTPSLSVCGSSDACAEKG